MASANLSFTKDGLIYRPQHQEEEEEEDFLTERQQKDGADICRVCRTASTPGRPLFHPCLCTGSIKYIHQECLVQWLKHSGKSHCELCKHEFEFNPIYHPSMPQHLSFMLFLRGVVRDVVKNVRHWFHLSLVAFVWLFIMPVCIYRIYRVLFYGTLWSFVRFPLELLSTDHLATDGFYGLMIVLVSLLGFISVVWLQDQIRHGGGPQWLEQDRNEVHRIERREAENELQNLQSHLDEVERRSRIRQSAPERVTAARDVTQAQEQRSKYMKQLQEVQSLRFDRRLEELRLKEMELSYDLGGSRRRYMLLLGGARTKHSKNVNAWRKDQITDRVLSYREEMGDDNAFPPDLEDYPKVGPVYPPPEWTKGLNREELAIMKLHNRALCDLSEAEREELQRQLVEVRQEQERVMADYEQHTQMICQVLTYGEHYVFNTKPDDNEEEEGEGEGEGGDDIENAEIGQLLPKERSMIRKLRLVKVELAEALRKERVITTKQNSEERQRRQDEENRMNRWYNRLLGRHQDDPLLVARRRRHNRANQRLNIGRALVGLARDRPPEPGPVDHAEEITWARLLGLDGSYRFLEHVVWLICLVSALIISLIYLPYQIGRLAAALISLWELLGIVTWKGAIATFIGYVVVCFIIIAFYYGMGWIKLPRVRSILGVTYVAIKVGMILAVEAGVFPLMCGWWIDICAFSLFGSTMTSRQDSLQRAPGTVMFLHWLAGMIFIFYLASFVMLLREVLRPGVLWFLRNLNDQNFHPVQEMIGLPMQRHLRRFVMSCLMFGVCVMFALLVPSRIISLLFSSFLPLNLTLASSISPIREIQLELILLQFVVPTLLEHGNSRTGLKFIIKHWAKIAATLFGLQSYLLDKAQTGGVVVDVHENVLRQVPFEPSPAGPAPEGSGPAPENPDPAPENPGPAPEGPGPAPENPGPAPDGPVYDGPAQVLGPGFAPFKPYLRPHFFHLRVVGFLVFTAAVAVTASVIAITLPVSVGRLLMGMVGVTQAPDIYTAAIGLYAVWLFVRVASSVLYYTSLGISSLTAQMSIWSLQGVKCVVAGFLLLVVIPLLLGHLVDLIIITPLRVPSDRTPLFYPSTEWALGLLHTKCICGAIWLTNIQFKQTLDQVYQAGVRNLDLTFIFKHVAWPIIVALSLIITLPYITFIGVMPITGLPYEHCLLVYRYFFPTVLAVLLLTVLVTVVVRQVNSLYENVRNEKYLVSRQLINYVDSSEEGGSIVEEPEPVQESGEH